MSTSFIKFKDYGFWAPDGELVIWVCLMLKELDEFPSQDWLKGLKKKWDVQVKIAGGGVLGLDLDKFIDAADRQSMITDVAENVLRRLVNQRKVLTSTDLKAMNLDTRDFRKEVPVQDVARIGTLFIRLLHGELRTTASSKIDYLGDM